jgi:hypothetical protein
MESFIFFLCGIGAVIWLLSCVNRNKKVDSGMANSNMMDVEGDQEPLTEASTAIEAINPEKAEKPEPHTAELMESALKAIGCQPEYDQDGYVAVQYQGENFQIQVGGMYARVWDPMWAAIKADDPNMPKVREAVNIANYNFGPTVIMTAPDENGVIGIHSRRDIMLHPACPDNALYSKAVLDSFFDAKDAVRSGYQQLNVMKVNGQQKRRPVGFATTQDPS